MNEINDNQKQESVEAQRAGRLILNLKLYDGTIDQLKESVTKVIKYSLAKENNKIHAVYIYSTNQSGIWVYKYTYSISDSIISRLSNLDLKLHEKFEIKKNMKPVLRVVGGVNYGSHTEADRTVY